MEKKISSCLRIIISVVVIKGTNLHSSFSAGNNCKFYVDTNTGRKRGKKHVFNFPQAIEQEHLLWNVCGLLQLK